MVKSYRTSLVKVALVTAAVALAVGCNNGNSTGGFDIERNFTIPLTTAEEVPTPTPSPASGSAEVVVYPQENQYRLTAASMTRITAAHIHVGAPGVAGPIASSSSPRPPGEPDR